MPSKVQFYSQMADNAAVQITGNGDAICAEAPRVSPCWTPAETIPVSAIKVQFNTPSTVAALGTAVSEISQQVLRQIEITIKNYERERSAEHDRTDLHEKRGLSDTRTEPERAGTDVAGADEAERSDGEPESERPDEVDGADEQPESAGGGNDTERAGFQLTLFPSEAEQISFIDEGTSVFDAPVPFTMSISQFVIDDILRLAGNRDNGRMEIVSEFSKSKGVKMSTQLSSRQSQTLPRG